MSEKNYLEKVREEMGLLEKIMSYIPGYRGYKERELRRESDRLVRMEAVNKLKFAKRIFRKKFANPLIVQMLSEDDAYRFEAFLARLDRVTQRVDRAVAGYAGMFDAVKVREDKLDLVIQHDLGLLERVESIKADVEKVALMEVGKEEWKNAMDELILKVEELDEFIDRRSEVIRGLSR